MKIAEWSLSEQNVLRAVLETSLAQLRVQSVELAGNGSVRAYAYLSTPVAADNYTMYVIQNLLQAAAGNKTIADNTYIYFKNVQKAVTSETLYESSELVTQLLGAAGEAERAWFVEAMHDISLNRIVAYPGAAQPRVMMLSSIPTLGRSAHHDHPAAKRAGFAQCVGNAKRFERQHYPADDRGRYGSVPNR